MSIALEKVKIASERFLLVRMNPARFILPVLNVSLYEITVPFLLNKIERNGVALTKVSGAPASDDEWSQDESTKLVQVKLASAPDSSTNVLTAYYYLFYTGTIFRAIGEDPETPLIDIRDWQPKIESYPNVLQSIDNVMHGVFTINDMSINIINTDREFQNYLTDEDSFYNKTLEMWLCIESVSNIQKIFSGVVTGLDIVQNIVTVTALDSFNKLKNKATMGDNSNEIYFSRDGFPNIVDKDEGKFCPFIVGNYSRYQTVLVRNGAVAQYLLQTANEAVCLSNDVPSGSVNRVWGCCRQKGNFKMQAWGTPTAALNFSGNDWYIKFSSISNVEVGDVFHFNDGSDQYGIVTHVGPFTYLGNPYDVVILDTSAAYSTSYTPISEPSFAVSVNNGTTDLPYHLRLNRDFTVAVTATSGGNNFVTITFVNGFEGVFPFNPLDPNKYKVLYRTSNDAGESHGQALKDICEKVKIDVNSASFTAADTAFDTAVRYQIPNFDETDYDIYLKYVEDVLGATLGFLKINKDFEAEYNLLEAPTSTDVRDKSLTLQDATGVNVGYADLVTQLIAYNPHNDSVQATTLRTPSPSETRENNKAKFLHSLENVERYRHPLETITDRIDAHMALKSERFAKYRFGTATQDIDSEINNDVQFENDIILGTTKIKDLKILTIDKSPKQTLIEASDLKGL